MYNKCECMQIGGKEWGSFQCKRSYIYIILIYSLSIGYIHAMITRFFVSFIRHLFVSKIANLHLKEPKTISIILIIFTPQPCRYFNLIEVICYLHSGVWYLCISINYNSFLTNCYLCPAHMASFVN